MAKKYDLTTEDKTQKSLAALIDEDLQKESKLLQNLISEVVDANQKLKASHQERLEKTQEKLKILNAEIERLKTDINEKDHETTLKQLNYLLDAKNQIYENLRQMRKENMRAYQEGDLHVDLNNLKETLQEILEEALVVQTGVKPFIQNVHEHIETFIKATIQATDTHFQSNSEIQSTLESSLAAFNDDTLSFNEAFKTFLASFEELFDKRTHMFLDAQKDLSLDERIQTTMDERQTALEAEEKKLKETFEADMQALDDKIASVHADTLNNLKAKHQERLDKERTTKENLAKDMKTLRLEIIAAEKKNDLEKLNNLLKAFDRKQKFTLNLFEEKLERKATKKVKSETEKLKKARMHREKEYLQALYDLKYRQAKAAIEKGDSKEVFKLREDLNALENDLSLNKDWIEQLNQALHNYEEFIQKAITFALEIQKLLNLRKKQFLEAEIKLVEQLLPLKVEFKKLYMALLKNVKVKHLNQKALGVQITQAVQQHEKQIELNQALAKLDKQHLDYDRHGEIERLGMEEDIQNEKIYQHALISLADKEYELQLLKIESLYDSEITLTKAQAERLNVGHDVNEAMVSTTLESQINFAKQQMKYAESEYQLRLQNIEQSLKRELDYAKEKLSQHQRPYKTDTLELEKERDRKLEDLSYKQALFREEKDKKELKEQENKIKENYAHKINQIEEKAASDPYVKRYKSQIEKAENRADKAQEDALKIKEKSVETFEYMLQNSEEKLQQFKDNNMTSTLAPYIESEASTTAKDRLDEAIEEAKNLYQDKISTPKDKLKSLDEQLENIRDETKQSEAIKALEAKKAELKEAFEKDTSNQDEALNQALSQIKDEQKAYLEEHDALEAKIKAPNYKKDIQALEARLKKTATQWEKNLSTMKQDQIHVLKEQLSKHSKALMQKRSRLDDALKPTIKAYQSYLKQTNLTQHKRSQQVKKELFKERDKAIKNLRIQYK